MARTIDVMPTFPKKNTQAEQVSQPSAVNSAPATRAIDVMPTFSGKTPTVLSETQSDPGVLSRLGNIFTGAAKSVGSAYTNVGGMVAEGAGKLNTRISNYANNDKLTNAQEAITRYQTMLDSGKWADGTPMTADDRKRVQSMMAASQRTLDAQKSHTDTVEAHNKETADKMYQTADQLSESGAQDIAQAKEGLGKVGQFAVDLGVQGVQMAGDIAASAVVPGSGLALMGARSAGSSAQEARQSGASYGQQLAYGLGSGALSVATEKISSVATPFKNAFGSGVLDKALSKAVGKMNGSAAGKAVLSMLSEGGEEVVEDLVQPVLQRMTYDKEALGQYGDTDYWAQTLYDGLVGAAMGGIGSGIEAVQNRRTARSAPPDATGAQPAAQEGNTPTQPQNAAETTQNAASGVETAVYRRSYDPIEAAAIRKVSKKFSNVVAGFDTSIADFFFKWKNGRKSHLGEPLEKLYIGKVTDAAKAKMSELLGYDVQSTDYIITADNVKHIMDQHGNAAQELQRGNLPLDTISMDMIADVVENPDRITLGDTENWEAARDGLQFEKDIGNGTVIYVQFDNFKRGTMEPRTLYIKKKGVSPSTVDATNATNTYTPEAIEPETPYVNPTIAQNAENVKTQGQRDILQEILFGGKRADMNTLTEAQQNAVYAANEAGTVGMDAAGNVFHVKPENHIDQRTAETVGSREVNAFQFDHPELHHYYQQAAQALIADADISLQQPMSRRYERTVQGNAVQQAAQTSAHLRQAMDETGFSRAELIDAAQRIVDDHGQENVAAAKRVELILNDMLSHGYTTMTGEHVAANTAYLGAKQAIPGAVQAEAGHGPDDIDRYDGLGNADAGTVNTAFDTMQAQSDEFHPVNPNSAQRIQNEQRRAPSEVPATNPETGNPITKTVSTILNSPLTSPEMAPVYENAIAGGQFDYEAVTDLGSVQRAQEKVSRDGYQSVANTFIARVDLGQTVTKYNMAEAVSAYNRAVSEGDHKTAFELTTSIAQAAHTSAQVVQAMNLMNRMTPEGRLLSLRRVVDRMNEQQVRDRRGRTDRERSRANPTQEQIDAARIDYIDMAQTFNLSDELATNYLMAETDEARAAAWDAITTDLANQIPSTFREKADFWRYTSMLTNPTTHIRNILGNAIQMGARKIKNAVGAGIEQAVLKDESQRTKAVLTRADRDLKQFARSQYETDQSAAMGERKYSDATMNGIHREIMDKRKMFRGDNIVSKAVQGIGDVNSAWLDREDVWFNRPAYVESFAQALKAKGVTAAEAAAGVRQADVDAARVYAISEAQKATYRNTTALSDALSRIGRYQGDNRWKRFGSFSQREKSYCFHMKKLMQTVSITQSHLTT